MNANFPNPLESSILLEIIAIEDEEQDCLVVIHAMGLTRQYHFLLEEV